MQASAVAENAGSSADPFSRLCDLFRGSLVGWQRAFLQKNRPSDTYLCIEVWRSLFSLIVYSSAWWCFWAADICEGNAVFTCVCDRHSTCNMPSPVAELCACLAALDLVQGLYKPPWKPFLVSSSSLTVLYKLLAKVIILNRSHL